MKPAYASNYRQEAALLLMTLREVLEKAIRLRETGQSELSLTLLNHVKQQGFESPWLEDDRARALLALGHVVEAECIWTQLEKCEVLSLRTVARQNLHLLAMEAEIERFHLEVQIVASQHCWSLSRLTSDLVRAFKFEYALLEEAILSRENGSIEASLALMDWALGAGFQSPWLQDNRARALVQLDRVVEACDVWRQICTSTALEDVREAAKGMLQSFSSAEEKQRQLQRESVWVEQARNIKLDQGYVSAIDHLALGLLNYPDSVFIEQALLKLLGDLRQQEDQSWSNLSQWIQQQELSVELFEHVLLVLETQPTMSGA